MATATLSERCELCGRRLGPQLGDRFRHLRADHEAYAHGLMLRMLAPVVFLVAIVGLAAFHAAPAAYVVALLASYALLFFGKIRSRKERTRAGTSPTPGLWTVLREGGYRFVMIVPIVAVLVVLLGRLS